MNFHATREGAFKAVALMEGLSFLILLFIAMPVKYLLHEPWLVQNFGMVHGLLFIVYEVLVVVFKNSFGWKWKETLLAAVGGFVPFGTFIVSARMLNHAK